MHSAYTYKGIELILSTMCWLAVSLGWLGAVGKYAEDSVKDG
jgi:hypothetical protein